MFQGYRENVSVLGLAQTSAALEEANVLRVATFSSLRLPAHQKRRASSREITAVQSLCKGLYSVTNTGGPRNVAKGRIKRLGVSVRGVQMDGQVLKPPTILSHEFCCKSFKPNANKLNLAMFKRIMYHRQNILS